MSHNKNSENQKPLEEAQAPQLTPLAPRRVLVGLGIFLLAALVLAIAILIPRWHNNRVLAAHTNEMAAPTVIALAPRPGAPISEVTLPGNLNAYSDAPLYARTSGYLSRWYFDIGAHVKKNALLAEIASPEIDRQVAQAEADLNTARANARNAQINSARYQDLLKTNSVSKQDTDTFINQSAALDAAVKSSEANLGRLEQLQSFEKIYAPFDGVVTARNIDVGQLIDSGANKELFHIQANATLRIYVNVPQVWSADMHVGNTATLTFAERPNRSYEAKLVRTSNAIDPASRTLLVELDIDNRNGELLPGSFAQVHFKVPAETNSLIIPVSALIFRQAGLQVAVVEGNHAHIVPVTLGSDDGRNVQVTSGLTADMRVIQSPPDSLIEGEEVRVVTTQPALAGGR
jgi:RND family efflux transporter MFP subunit